MKNNGQILVIDSGIGGLSVLRELRKVLPNEDYVYFGDSKNAPYGEKTKEIILSLATNNISNLIQEYNIKACVVACNTLSVNCLSEIRKNFSDLIVVGIVPNFDEPLKDYVHGKILVLSTPLTAGSSYFKNLNTDRVVSIGMPGLVNLIENLKFDEKEYFEYFDNNLLKYLDDNICAISLGCTHYPFIREILQKYIMSKNLNVRFYDGIGKTINHLKSELESHKLLNSKDICGDLTMLNSSMDDSIIEKSFELLSK